jgi:hypothetical protein
MAAVVIFFFKADETPVQVVYAFGPSKKNLHRRMVIDKATYLAQPADGQADVMFEGARVKIMRLVAQGQWPERGVHAV